MKTTKVTPRAVSKITLSLRNCDASVWDRARRLVGKGGSLSSFVTEAVREHAERQERAQRAGKKLGQRMAPIELISYGHFGDAPKHIVRFTGVLIGDGVGSRVYATQSGQFVASLKDSKTDLPAVWVFDTLDELAENAGGTESHFDHDAIVEAFDAAGRDFFVDLD